MRLWKLMIIAMAVVGIVLSCGCTSSNTNVATGEMSSSNQNVQSTANNVKTETAPKQVSSSPFSDKVTIQYNGRTFTIDKYDYDCMVNHKVPEWAIEKMSKATGYPISEIKNITSSKYFAYEYGVAVDFGIGYLQYRPDLHKFIYTWMTFGNVVRLPGSSYNDFCYFVDMYHNFNFYKVERNREKFEKQYEQCVKYYLDTVKWFNNTVRGKPVFQPGFTYGIYCKNLDEPIEIYILKNSYHIMC